MLIIRIYISIRKSVPLEINKKKKLNINQQQPQT